MQLYDNSKCNMQHARCRWNRGKRNMQPHGDFKDNMQHAHCRLQMEQRKRKSNSELRGCVCQKPKARAMHCITRTVRVCLCAVFVPLCFNVAACAFVCMCACVRVFACLPLFLSFSFLFLFAYMHLSIDHPRDQPGR